MKTDNNGLRAPTVEKTLEVIREKLILNKFSTDKVLTENMLSEMYGVSRGTIRSVFQQLEKEGLIVTLDNGRRLPVKITEKFIRDFYDVRIMIEKEACRIIISNPDLSIAPLTGAFSAFYNLYAYEGEELFLQKGLLNTAFHRTMVEMTENRSLLECWNTVEPLVDCIAKFNYTFLENEQSNEELIEIHKRLMDLIMDRDTGCYEELRLHITKAIDESIIGIRRLS